MMVLSFEGDQKAAAKLIMAFVVLAVESLVEKLRENPEELEKMLDNLCKDVFGDKIKDLRDKALEVANGDRDAEELLGEISNKLSDEGEEFVDTYADLLGAYIKTINHGCAWGEYLMKNPKEN